MKLTNAQLKQIILEELHEAWWSRSPRAPEVEWTDTASDEEAAEIIQLAQDQHAVATKRVEDTLAKGRANVPKRPEVSEEVAKKMAELEYVAFEIASKIIETSFEQFGLWGIYKINWSPIQLKVLKRIEKKESEKKLIDMAIKMLVRNKYNPDERDPPAGQLDVVALLKAASGKGPSELDNGTWSVDENDKLNWVPAMSNKGGYYTNFGTFNEETWDWEISKNAMVFDKTENLKYVLGVVGLPRAGGVFFDYIAEDGEWIQGLIDDVIRGDRDTFTYEEIGEREKKYDIRGWYDFVRRVTRYTTKWQGYENGWEDVEIDENWDSISGYADPYPFRDNYVEEEDSEEDSFDYEDQSDEAQHEIWVRTGGRYGTPHPDY